MALVVYQGPQNGVGDSGDSPVSKESRFVGLANQGATCYLNGLLQTLFMTPEFRMAIFKWNYDASKDGTEDLCIPLQLQRLFGLLQLSKQRSVDTVALTKSFGWEGFEVFQQQDVQELTRVLFDALEETFKGTESEHIIDELYAGQLVDYIRCIDVDYQSERVDKFLDFSLAIVPFGSNQAMHSLAECIEMFLRPELLDGDNKYFCEAFDRKVDAIKGLKFGKLPYIMAVQLKRFVFDFSGANVVQKKLNDEVRFPMVLDMNKYVAKKQLDGEEVDNEEFESFLFEQMEKLRTSPVVLEDPEVPPLSPVSPAWDDLDTPEDAKEEVKEAEEVCYESLSEESLQELLVRRGEWVYELYAVLVHSGAISGGHYYAYIKDLDSNKWYNFNDSTVSLIDEKTVRSAWGGQQQSSSYNSYGSYGTSYYPSYKPYTSCANGYMLMYRKVQLGARILSVPDDVIPAYIREQVASTEAARLLKAKEEEELRSRLHIKVTYKGVERTVPAKRTDKYMDFLTSLWQALELDDTLPSDEEGLPLDLLRLRDYNTYSRTTTGVYDYDVAGQKTLGELNFGDYRSYLLETRSRDQTWEPYYADGFSVLVEDFDALSGFFNKALHTIRLQRFATLGDLRTALGQKLSYPDHIRFLKLIAVGYTDGRYEVLEGDDKRLREELVIYDGLKVFVEDARTCPAVKSLAFQAFVDGRNRLEIKCSLPHDTIAFDQLIRADGRWTVQELRKHIADTFALPLDKIRLFKQSVRGAELKDSDLTLSANSIYNGMCMAVSLGMVVPIGYYQVKLSKFTAAGYIAGVKLLPDLPDGSPPAVPVDLEDIAIAAAIAEDFPDDPLDAQYTQDSSDMPALVQIMDDAVETMSNQGVADDDYMDALEDPVTTSSEVQEAEAKAESGSGTTSQDSASADTDLEPSAFGELMVKNAVSYAQFENLDDIESIHISSSMDVSEVRRRVRDDLVATGRLPADYPLSRLRLRDRYHLNPGKILRDHRSLKDHDVYLVDNKSLAYELLDADEDLPEDDHGDVIVLAQRWERSSWTLAERCEVLLPGHLPVRDIARGLSVLFHVPLEHLRVLVVPKETEFYLHELSSSGPSRLYGRSWFDPTTEGKLLRFMSHEMRVQDGDLLILQDASEELKALSPADRKSIQIVEAASRGQYPYAEPWGTSSSGSYGTYSPVATCSNWPFNGTGSGTASPSVSVKPRGANGVKIKTLKERMREEEAREAKRSEDGASDAELASVSSAGGSSSRPPVLQLDGPVSSVSTSRAGAGSPVESEPKTGCSVASGDFYSADNSEFVKQGGMSLFEGML